MGNLIACKDSFIWEDNTIDRNSIIDSLNEALVEARSFGDNIYAPLGFFDIQVSWGDFITFIFETLYDDERRNTIFPWMGQLQHQTLVNIFAFFQSTTDGNATGLEEMRNEFPNDNNGETGFKFEGMPENMVYDVDTWTNFHSQYVLHFSYEERRAQYDYFIKFIRPTLQVALNGINQLINQGNLHSIFRRIDRSLVLGEQIHMHFNDQHSSALNIDGTWKHAGFNIPMEARKILSDLGFVLPRMFY